MAHSASISAGTPANVQASVTSRSRFDMNPIYDEPTATYGPAGSYGPGSYGPAGSHTHVVTGVAPPAPPPRPSIEFLPTTTTSTATTTTYRDKGGAIEVHRIPEKKVYMFKVLIWTSVVVMLISLIVSFSRQPAMIPMYFRS